MLASSSTIRMLGIVSLPSLRLGSSVWSVRLGGNLDHERRAAPRGTVDLDRAVVIGDDALDDREPEPGAVRLRREAGHEQLRALLLAQARSVVGHREEHFVAGPGSAGYPRHGDAHGARAPVRPRPARRRGVETVLDK